MRLLIAPDKFKDSLSAEQACKSIKDGIQKARPDIEVVSLPLSDGGDGFARLMTNYTNGVWHQSPVYGPLLTPLTAGWGWQPTLKHAWLDSAEVLGISLLAKNQRNPLHTSSFGLGQLLKLVANSYTAKHVTIGLGGSSTHDGGCGMAAALGYKFLDKTGQGFIPVGSNLLQIARIVKPKDLHLPPIVACADVLNPFTGNNGAANTYAKQKGASGSDLKLLEEGSLWLRKRLAQDLGVNESNLPGSGAAGGLGLGLTTFTNAKITDGSSKIIKLLKVAEQVGRADIVITGEGLLDASSFSGKITGALIQLAKSMGKPIVVFCGSSSIDLPSDISIRPIALTHSSLEQNLQMAAGLLQDAAYYYTKNLPN